MGRPLEGLLVVAIEQAVAAPLCTLKLAEAGARVVKIERDGRIRERTGTRQTHPRVVDKPGRHLVGREVFQKKRPTFKPQCAHAIH